MTRLNNGFAGKISESMNGLEISHLHKSYGRLKAVDDLSFHVEPGEIFGLIGPNGAGKSTTMLMIIGILRPDSGSITFNGSKFDPSNPDMRSQLGVAPQELAIYPELTAAQNLRFFGSINGLSGNKLKERVDFVLNLTGLTANADQTTETFSGGMSRRLNFGIALLHEPRFVILDEPTVGIDPQSRTNLLDNVRELAKGGVGVIYTSHYMEEVEAICDRVGVMDHGRMLRYGTLDELLDRSSIDLCISVDSLPADISKDLKQFAAVQTNGDHGLNIVIKEDIETHRKGQSNRLRAVLDLLERGSIPLDGIHTRETSLETLFLSLTGRKLRD